MGAIPEEVDTFLTDFLFRTFHYEIIVFEFVKANDCASYSDQTINIKPARFDYYKYSFFIKKFKLCNNGKKSLKLLTTSHLITVKD